MQNGDIQKENKKSYKMPVILVVVWVLIIMLFGYGIWQDKSDESSNDISFEETTIAPAANTNTTPADNMTDEQKNQARIRDSMRLSHMRMLQSILQSYYDDNEYYPEYIKNLVPDYLESLPQNPGPGGRAYVYTGIGSKPYSFYDMSYVLEVGADGIGSGMHIMSPSGIATP